MPKATANMSEATASISYECTESCCETYAIPLSKYSKSNSSEIVVTKKKKSSMAKK